MRQTTLYEVHEALIQAKQRGWIVGFLMNNGKAIQEILECTTFSPYWKMTPLIEDIKKLGNAHITKESVGSPTHAFRVVTRWASFASNIKISLVFPLYD